MGTKGAESLKTTQKKKKVALFCVHEQRHSRDREGGMRTMEKMTTMKKVSMRMSTTITKTLNMNMKRIKTYS